MKRAGFTLVVDDDECVRTSLQALLEIHGHSVVLAEDIPGAIRQLAFGIPELLICDYMLNRQTPEPITALPAFDRIPRRILLTGHEANELDVNVANRFSMVINKANGQAELLAVIRQSNSVLESVQDRLAS